MSTFGDYISRERRYSKMTQEQLAEKMGVSKQSVQNWESGRTKVKTAHIKKLAYLFNVPETKLYSELNRDNDAMKNDIFPYFLFENDSEELDIIKSLHLNLNQQELFGLICLYCKDLLPYIYQESAFDEAITQIPSGYVCKVGSIQFINLSDGLRYILKYVDHGFLLKVLKLYPDEIFDVTRLSKELIIEFIDNGHIPYVDYHDDAIGIDFFVNMKKARYVLPILEKSEICLANEYKCGAELCKDIPDEIIEAALSKNKAHILINVINGIERVTNLRMNEEDGKCYWSINDTGRKLLEWFRK